MKKTHFIGIGLIAVAIGLFMMAGKDMSQYSNFDQAGQQQRNAKVVAQLAKDKEMVYDPAVDPNYFSFYAVDSEGEERKVVLLKAKPQDFELSEQLVLTGKMVGDEFHASDMLMKCPSKYKDEEIYIKQEQG
jgi:cytochrome c-type biogenesis protein CcmE